MKMLRYFALPLLSISLLTTPLLAAATADATSMSNVKTAFVSFKTCVDQSKLGKEEQSNFEALRKQMEASLEEKEKTLTDLANKFNDADFLDSLSPEAETELKRKYRALNQELNQIQNQFYQTLSQANMKVIQKLQEAVVIASKTVAEQKNIDFVMTEESAFFYNPKFDVSSDVIAVMNNNYDQEIKKMKEVQHGTK